MLTISSRNVNTMLPAVMSAIRANATPWKSRNGPVLKFPYPVCLTYTNPLERVVFDATRDANPFFHFMESMWMLAGRRDVEFVKYYNSNMASYSDDGEVFNAAYGFRMRQHFGVDQLIGAVEELSRDPYSRQCVINLWAPSDLGKVTKDKACNLALCFQINNESEALDLTVFNRSNDAVWGAVTGANPVHMSYFLQFVANSIGRMSGAYHQITTNLHLYTENEKSKAVLGAVSYEYDRYRQESIGVPVLMDTPNPEIWLIEIENFCKTIDGCRDQHRQIARQYVSSFINTVAVPIHNAFACRKRKDREGTEYWLNECEDRAWAVACMEWCARRDAK